MSLQDIVNVSITRQTAVVTSVGFGTAMIVGSHKAFNERIRFYSSQTAVLVDFASTDQEAIASNNVFSQNPRVVQVAIGRRNVDDAALTVLTAEDSTTYTVTINGTDFSFASAPSGDTVEIIATGLVNAVNAGSEPVTATDGTGGNFTLAADVSGTAYTLAINSLTLLSITAFVPDDAIDTDLVAIDQADNNWYGIISTSKTSADILLVAAFAESRIKLYGASSSEADIIGLTDAADTTSIAALLKAGSFARTFLFYDANAATQFMEGGLFGVILPKNPGSYTAKFKTLAGVTISVLNDTEKKNALDKNANTYTEVGGQNIVEEGTVSAAEFIDIIVFVDSLQSDMTVRVFSLLVNTDKVPFTDQGIATVEAEVRSALDAGVTAGGIAASPPFTVTVPLAANISGVDKAARLLKDITFQATLAGAIHEVQINGTVTV